VAAFDEICGCSFEDETYTCVCMRRKDQARTQCTKCLAGKHSLEPRIDAAPLTMDMVMAQSNRTPDEAYRELKKSADKLLVTSE
jgi:hypothetical protein